MKRGAIEHPKLIALTGRLGVSRAAAVGHFEAFLHYVAKYTPCGAAGKFGIDALARHSLWEGDPPVFVAAMVDAGLLERGTLHVHDWPEHCDDAVHMALARSIRTFADGTMPKLSRFGREEKACIQAEYAKTHTVRVQNAQETHAVRFGNAQETHCPPLPSPPLSRPLLPSPPPPSPVVGTDRTTTTPKAPGSFDGTIPNHWRVQIVADWNAARANGRPASVNDARLLNEAIWAIHREPTLTDAERADPFGFLRAKALAYLRSHEATKDGGKWRSTLGNFLRKERFLETPEQWNHKAAVEYDPHEETRIRIALSKGEQP